MSIEHSLSGSSYPVSSFKFPVLCQRLSVRPSLRPSVCLPVCMIALSGPLPLNRQREKPLPSLDFGQNRDHCIGLDSFDNHLWLAKTPTDATYVAPLGPPLSGARVERQPLAESRQPLPPTACNCHCSAATPVGRTKPKPLSLSL